MWKCCGQRREEQLELKIVSERGRGGVSVGKEPLYPAPQGQADLCGVPIARPMNCPKRKFVLDPESGDQTLRRPDDFRLRYSTIFSPSPFFVLDKGL